MGIYGYNIDHIIAYKLIEQNLPTPMEPQKSQKELGNQEYKNSNYKKAIEHYRQYVEADHDDNIQAMSNIALCYFKLELFEHAIQACDEALAIDEKYVKCYYRRALSRKAILSKDKNDKIQKYKLYYDTKMFKRFSEPGTNIKQIEELNLISNTLKQQFIFCDPVKITPFQRDLLEIQKENLNLLSLSWLEQKKMHEVSNIHQSGKYKINSLYKELVKANRQIKDQEQKKTIIEHIKRRIIQIRQTQQKQQNVQLQEKIDQAKTVKQQPQPQALESQSSQQKKHPQSNQAEIKNISQTQKQQEQKTQHQQEGSQTAGQKNQQIVNKDNTEQKQKNQDSISIATYLSNKNQVKQTIENHKNQQYKVEVPSQQNKNLKQVLKFPAKAEEKKQHQEKNDTKVNNQPNNLTKLKLNSIKKEENIQQMNVQQIYKHYFGDQFKKTRDQFTQFGINILDVLQKKQLSISKKQQILMKVAKTLSNFKLLAKNLPKQQRNNLNQLLQKSEFSKQLKKEYLIK